jgi:hypothetical protein
VCKWCTPIGQPLPDTNANLTGCYLYERPKSNPPGIVQETIWCATLGIGWVTIIVFFATLFIAAWYLLGIVVWLAGSILSWLTITPGLTRLFLPRG